MKKYFLMVALSLIFTQLAVSSNNVLCAEAATVTDADFGSYDNTQLKEVKKSNTVSFNVTTSNTSHIAGVVSYKFGIYKILNNASSTVDSYVVPVVMIMQPKDFKYGLFNMLHTNGYSNLLSFSATIKSNNYHIPELNSVDPESTQVITTTSYTTGFEINSNGEISLSFSKTVSYDLGNLIIMNKSSFVNDPTNKIYITPAVDYQYVPGSNVITSTYLRSTTTQRGMFVFTMPKNDVGQVEVTVASSFKTVDDGGFANYNTAANYKNDSSTYLTYQ